MFEDRSPFTPAAISSRFVFGPSARTSTHFTADGLNSGGRW